MAPDLVLFLLVVAAFFVVGLPLINRKVWLPMELEVEDVTEAELTDGQRDHFARLDDELGGLGYRPAKTYTVANLQGYNLIRTYLSDADPAMVHAMLMRADVGLGDAPSALNYVEVATRYADGTSASTRNGDVSSVFVEPPNVDLAVRRTAVRVNDLKQAHDRRTEAFRIREPLYARADQIDDLLTEHHRKWTRYQLDRGALSLDAEAGRLRPTVRTGLRGIGNFLNPFADNATPARVVLGLLLGLGLPVAGVLLFGDPDAEPVQRLAAALGQDPPLVRWAALTTIFALLGLATGWLFESKSFIWTFLLAWLPLRLVGPDLLPTLLLSLWAGGVAVWICNRRVRRRALV
jgi:hypothetical protein